MAFDISQIGTLSQLVADDPKLQMEMWVESVRADARDENPLKDFIGGDGSGMPFIEKRDATVTGGQKVYFSTHAPVLGRGVMGSSELKSKTATVRYGSYGVTVDLRRFAISEEQLLAYFSLPGNADKNRDEFLYDLCRQWWVRTQCDDIQIVLRNKALFGAGQPNMLRVGGGADVNAIKLTDTYDTAAITNGKNALVGLGATAMKYGVSKAGAKIPQFLTFGPTRFLETLENEQKFREAINNNQVRGDEAYWWTGALPVWKNNVIFTHDIIVDSGPNRQGSPLAPLAFLGVPLADGTATSITGGGNWNSAGTLTDATLFDFFSYFGGYGWKTYTNEVLPTDNNTYYAMIYNLTGANARKYEIISWTAAGNLGNTITVTREVAAAKTKLTAAGRYSNVHPTGSLIIPCNSIGTPIGYALQLGADALLIGKGALEADPIEWADDFQSKTSGRAHINAQGIQSIIGYSPAEDTIGRYPNFLVVEGALDYPDLGLVDLT